MAAGSWRISGSASPYFFCPIRIRPGAARPVFPDELRDDRQHHHRETDDEHVMQRAPGNQEAANRRNDHGQGECEHKTVRPFAAPLPEPHQQAQHERNDLSGHLQHLIGVQRHDSRADGERFVNRNEFPVCGISMRMERMPEAVGAGMGMDTIGSAAASVPPAASGGVLAGAWSAKAWGSPADPLNPVIMALLVTLAISDNRPFTAGNCFPATASVCFFRSSSSCGIIRTRPRSAISVNCWLLNCWTLPSASSTERWPLSTGEYASTESGCTTSSEYPPPV